MSWVCRNFWRIRSRTVLTLGIETSCDETAVALLEGRRVLADAVASSALRHSDFGGVVPEIASRSHVDVLLPCLDRVLKEAGVPLSRVQLIAVTQGPGLLGSLVVGVAAAKALALVLKKRIVPVDHVLAHAFSGHLERRRVKYPFVSLVVSGGHTLLVHWKSLDNLSIIGRTVDDAAGEAFDKVAKILELGYPGGPIIDRLSKQAEPSRYHFPRPWIQEKHYHFSFSGLKTAVLYKVQALKAQKKLSRQDKAEICSAFQEAVCDVLVDKSLRACRDYRTKTLLVGGGVSANTRLREKLRKSSKRGSQPVSVHFPSMRLAADNAIMIAALGQVMFRHRRKQNRGRALNGKALGFGAYSDFFVQKKARVL